MNQTMHSPILHYAMLLHWQLALRAAWSVSCCLLQMINGSRLIDIYHALGAFATVFSWLLLCFVGAEKASELPAFFASMMDPREIASFSNIAVVMALACNRERFFSLNAQDMC